MTIRTIDDFLAGSGQRDATQEPFELENPHLLEVRLHGVAWAKAGSMVAYTGGVKFRREGMLEQGLGNLLKKAVSGEGAQLMKMEGQGRVWLADGGKKVTLLRLQGEAIFVNGNDVLAFAEGLESRITMMRKVAGMMAGGLFNIRLSGHGLIAIGSHYEPLTLKVRPGRPVHTDPNATVAWSDGLEPDLVTDLTLGSLVGRTSGESLQMKFAGDGWVVVQPYEEGMAARGRG
jgi:uncharacterized protein (AIM24 family)